MQDKQSQIRARGASVADLTPLSEVIEDVFTWLENLQAEAERGAEQHAPLRGPVTRRQRPWSGALDRIAAEREAASS